MSPIGPSGSGIRRRSDELFTHLICPAVSAVGFEAVRADQIDEQGRITDQILAHIFGCPLAIADLTGVNPNVMYELALRHACQLPVWQVVSDDTHLPFDVSDIRTIKFDRREINEYARARSELTQLLHAFVKGIARYQSPVPSAASHSLGLSEQQTLNLYELHQGNSAFNIYWVIDRTLSAWERDPDSFHPETFLNEIESALIDSRTICTPFVSELLGSLYTFFTEANPTTQLRKDVMDGIGLIKGNLDPGVKRTRLLAHLRRRQDEYDSLILRAIEFAKHGTLSQFIEEIQRSQKPPVDQQV